jgi:hypothetical protein
MEANSVFHAAVLFYSHCVSLPPRVDRETVVEVKPFNKVRIRDAMVWANDEARRPHAKNKK